jgi:two-component sensor histidine kinase
MTTYDDLALVVSELVTNAIMHAAGAIVVELHRLERSVRVVVGDDAAALPTERSREVDQETGRGLQLVAAFASAWGTEKRAGGGKAVWAELTIESPDGTAVVIR